MLLPLRVVSVSRRLSTTAKRLSGPVEHVLKGNRTGYIPRRAVLYVPGSEKRMLDKVPKIQADCVALELEDGVALSAKTEARINVREYFEGLSKDPSHECFELAVRINSVASGLLHDDLKELSKAEHLPQAFIIPKVDSPEELATIWDAFRTTYGADRISKSVTRLIVMTESPRGLLDLPRILNTTLNMHNSSGFFKLDAAIFGSDDYCASIGATRSTEGSEVTYARQRFVACCKAFNLQAIDAVHIDIKDVDSLQKQSIQGCQWGFNGKQCIHPSQVPIIQSAFTPPPDRVEWSEELIREFAKHEESGKGSFVFDGKMVDKPLLLQAMNTVRLIELVKGKRFYEQ
ncbi:Protein C01G10.7 [Aphelenchoides avenae]|nr:Protein C01G10.7 [Aphelenchus avenae]